MDECHDVASALAATNETSSRPLLHALKAFLPPRLVRYTLAGSPPPHVQLMRLSKVLVDVATARWKEHERGCKETATQEAVSPFLPVAAVMSDRFRRRLAPYFGDLTLGDISEVPLAILAASAAPVDALYMRVFLQDKRHVLEAVAAGLRAAKEGGTFTAATANKTAAETAAATTTADETAAETANETVDACGEARACASGVQEAEATKKYLHWMVKASDEPSSYMRRPTYSRDAFLSLADNHPSLLILDLAESNISDVDYADIGGCVGSGSLPRLQVLCLRECGRIGDNLALAVLTTHDLLRARPALRIDLTFCTSILNLRTKGELFSSLTLQEVCRLIWASVDWFKDKKEGDARGDDLVRQLLADACKDIPRQLVFDSVKTAHEEHVSVMPYNA